MSVSKSVIRACLLYEFKLGNTAADATRKISSAFGDNVISERCGRRWFKKFASGCETLEDAPRSGRPPGLDEEEQMKLKESIESNSSQACKELAKQFNVSDETIRVHLQQIGKIWKLNKWVPQEKNGNKIKKRIKKGVAKKVVEK